MGRNLAGTGWAMITTGRRRHREGYHFATEVARKAAKKLKIPFYEGALTIGNSDRLKPAMELTVRPEEKNLILFDDIITTGTTAGKTAELMESEGYTVETGSDGEEAVELAGVRKGAAELALRIDLVGIFEARPLPGLGALDEADEGIGEEGEGGVIDVGAAGIAAGGGQKEPRDIVLKALFVDLVRGHADPSFLFDDFPTSVSG